MKPTFLAIAAAALLTGCAGIETPLDDGYQIGDFTGTALELQARYCTEADPYQRAVRMVLLQRAGVTLPDDGACTDALEVLSGSALQD